jgi:hypothetical protein
LEGNIAVPGFFAQPLESVLFFLPLPFELEPQLQENRPPPGAGKKGAQAEAELPVPEKNEKKEEQDGQEHAPKDPIGEAVLLERRHGLEGNELQNIPPEGQALPN